MLAVKLLSTSAANFVALLFVIFHDVIFEFEGERKFAAAAVVSAPELLSSMSQFVFIKSRDRF